MPQSDLGSVADAVGKVADLGTQSLQTGEKLGGFLARVFKEPTEQASGIVADWLKVKRLERWDKLAERVGAILERRGVTDTRAVPPKLGIPLLENAALEDELSLQILWSRLLANAMDPAFSAEVRVAYTEIIQSLSVIDAKILALMYRSLLKVDRLEFAKVGTTPFRANQICEALGVGREDYEIAIYNLVRLNCVGFYIEPISLGNGLSTSGQQRHLSAHANSNTVVLTPLGVRFVEACTDDSDRLDLSDTVATERRFAGTVDLNIKVGPR